MEFRYTLLSDGSSDRVLTRVIDWALARIPGSFQFQSQWADPAVIRKRKLPDRIRRTLQGYPTDLLFVHRDAERADPLEREEEVVSALREAGELGFQPCVIVPVRMTEAWFLFDEASIRAAAGNPLGTVDLGLPPAQQWEALADPKDVLFRALTVASERSGRRAKAFRPESAYHQLAERIRDYGPLRSLSSFQRFERKLLIALKALEAAHGSRA